MSESESGEFARQVLNALANTHDPVYLQTHPLVRFVQGRRTLSPTSAGRALRQALLDVIASLRPPAERLGDDRATRRYRVLHLRYGEGLEPEEVRRRLGIGKSLFYTEHKVAVDAVIAALRERWLTSRAPDSPPVVDRDGDQSEGNETPAVDARLPLPAALTSFVGRETDLPNIVRLLGLSDAGSETEAEQPGVRLLTLVGPAGAGKTRLALEVGRIGASSTEVCFVELALVREAGLVLPTIARAAGGRDGTQEAVVAALEARSTLRGLLLILDNLEQVLEASPQVTNLLRAVPRLRVLATSRTALGVYGEWEFPVAPLPLPPESRRISPSAARESAAVRLFLERAAAVRPDFQLDDHNATSVVEIARRLDGLPLALELAAARVRHLSPAEIVTRLEHRLDFLASGPRDLPDRQRTLEGAIAWSYHLLDQADQAVFRRLGAFIGGAPLAAAAAVCDGGAGQPASQERTRTRLESLAAQSLVHLHAYDGDVPRCVMLETIREYALAQLVACGEVAETRERHASYFLRLTEEAEQHLLGPEQSRWLRRLDADYANVRASVRWFIDSRQTEPGLRLASALRQYWLLHGHWSEGREWLTELLTLTESEESDARVKALDRAGTLAGMQGDRALARRFFEDGLALARRLGNRAGEGRCLVGLGNTFVADGDYARARAHHQDALAISGQENDTRGVSNALAQIGITFYLEGAYAEAEEVLAESLAIRRSLDDLSSVAHSLNMLGTVLRCAGVLDRAHDYLEECRRACAELGHRLGSAVVGLNLALVAIARREDASAAEHLVRSLALYRELGDNRGVALGLEVAGLVLCQKDPEAAAEILGAAALAVERSGARRPPVDTALLESARITLRSRLGEEACGNLHDRGKSLTTHAACDLALNRLTRLQELEPTGTS